MTRMTGTPRGVICPLVTPLTTAEEVDTEALHRLIGRVAPEVDGFMLLGTTGELATLPVRTADQLVTAALEAIGPDRTVLLGVGAAGTSQAIEQLHRCTDRIDFVAACSPYYFTGHDHGSLVGHFAAIAEASGAPLVLYNIPGNTHQEIPVEVVRELRDHPRIAGIKDSSAVPAYVEDLLRLRGPGFAVLQGNESLAVASRQGGVDGFVSGLENIAPGTMRRLTAAIDASGDAGGDAGGDGEVAELVGTVRELLAMLSRHAEIPLSTLKSAVAVIDGGTGHGVRPLPRLTDRQRALLTADMRTLRLVP